MSKKCEMPVTPPQVRAWGGTYENGICEELPRADLYRYANGTEWEGPRDSYVCVEGDDICECVPRSVYYQRLKSKMHRLQLEMMMLQQKYMKRF